MLTFRQMEKFVRIGNFQSFSCERVNSSLLQSWEWIRKYQRGTSVVAWWEHAKGWEDAFEDNQFIFPLVSESCGLLLSSRIKEFKKYAAQKHSVEENSLILKFLIINNPSSPQADSPCLQELKNLRNMPHTKILRRRKLNTLHKVHYNLAFFNISRASAICAEKSILSMLLLTLSAFFTKRAASSPVNVGIKQKQLFLWHYYG